ncbi:hypothetical protein ACFL6Y_06395 [Elusimicrobiota bacterium]
MIVNMAMTPGLGKIVDAFSAEPMKIELSDNKPFTFDFFNIPIAYGWFSQNTSDTISLNRTLVGRTISHLKSMGYSDHKALDIASRLWMSTLSHETIHAIDFQNLKKITGLDYPPYVREMELNAFSSAGYFTKAATAGLPQDIWGTSYGKHTQAYLAAWELGPLHLRDWVAPLYKNVPAIYGSDPEETIRIYAKEMAESSNPSTKKACADAIEFWKSPDLIQKTQEYFDERLKEQEELWPHLMAVWRADREPDGALKAFDFSLSPPDISFQ